MYFSFGFHASYYYWSSLFVCCCFFSLVHLLSLVHFYSSSCFFSRCISIFFISFCFYWFPWFDSVYCYWSFLASLSRFISTFSVFIFHLSLGPWFIDPNPSRWRTWTAYPKAPSWLALLPSSFHINLDSGPSWASVSGSRTPSVWGIWCRSVSHTPSHPRKGRSGNSGWTLEHSDSSILLRKESI